MEEELAAAGNRLLQPPDSVDELLPLLDQTEDNLAKVEQSPGKSMQATLSPLLKALVADELLKHPDINVKVAVASCINEITRITAPDAPYDDEKMKDIFQLIVSSFEHLYDTSSRSYAKRAMILETVSKVRSCVIMLDLECDQMIVDMFQHFLKAIRDYHPENIFSSMETIMTLVLEESEDISSELLTVLLASVKRNNEELLPVAMKLGERVFEKCGVKLKPYLTRTVKSLGISLDDYSEVVASICKETDGPVGQNSDSTHGDQLVSEKKSAGDPSDQGLETLVTDGKSASDSPDRTLATQMAKDVTGQTSSEEQNPNVKSSPNGIVSNGVDETRNGGILTNADFKKEEALDDGLTSKTASDDLTSEKPISLEPKPEQASKEIGREPNSSNNSIETSDIDDGDKEIEQEPDQLDSEDKDIHIPPGEASVETAKPLDTVKETENHLSPSNASEREVLNAAFPSPTGSLLDENRPKKGGRKRRNENLIKEKRVSDEAASEKAFDGASDSEARKRRGLGRKETGRKEPAEISNENQVLAEEDECKDGGPPISHSEEKLPNETDKPVAVGTNNKKKDGSSSKKEYGIKRGRVKAGVKIDVLKSSAKDDAKHTVASPNNSIETSDIDDGEKETEQEPDQRDSEDKDIHISPCEASVETAKPLDMVKETVNHLSPSNASEREVLNVAFPSPTGSLLDENRPKKGGRKRRYESLIKEKRVSDDAASDKAFDGASDSEAKKRRRLGRKESGRKEPAEISNENQALAEEDECKDGGPPVSHSEEKLPNETDKPVSVDTNNKKKDGSSSKKEYGIKRGRVKAGVKRDVLKSSTKDDAKHTVASPRSPRKSTKDEGNQEETPRMSSKRKGTPSTDKASGTIEYGENLVGSKVKVWWPDDHMFYEGVVDSFDSVRKKHKIVYQDGDEEILYLKNEKWEFIKDDLVLDAGQPVECASADTPSEMKTKKAKTNPEASSNDGKGKISRKSKLKNNATTSGRKSKHDAEADLKSNDDTSSSGGKSLGDSPKAPGKSKDIDTVKTSGHSKQDTHKTSNSKGKSPRSSHTVGANGKGKTESSLSKFLKDIDHVKKKTTNIGKMSEIKKGKSQDTSTPPVSETKTTGKKRRRGTAS